MDELKKLCASRYNETYTSHFQKCLAEQQKKNKGKPISEEKTDEIEKMAQKEAIKVTTLSVMKEYPDVEAAEIWKLVYGIHVYMKSGISDHEAIAKVISAHQSWVKSSGHAFEEMIKFLGNIALKNSGIEILLQRDLSMLIKTGGLDNEPRDISWLKEQLKGNIFDLYTVITQQNKRFCFGCIQSKTSIRDRVTRDREPSIQAMHSFFWSICVVLDGDFLKNGKFINMVDGGTTEHPENGWHGLYVFSEDYTKDRIYPTDYDMKNLKEHAIEAANYWLHQRQWFDIHWKAKD